MLPCRLPIVGLIFAMASGLLATGASATDPPPVAKAEAAAEQPPPKTAEAVAPAVGFAAEFGERLAPGDKLSAVDREDRAALAAFFASRQHEPVWTTATGLTPAAQAAVDEIRRADDWALDASAFRLPELSSVAGTELTRAARADAEVTLSLAILKYARYARGGRAEPTSLSRNLDRKLPLLDPQRVIQDAAKSPSPDAYLRSLHPQHPQFEALRQKYLALKHGQPVAPSQAGPAEGKAGKKKAAGAAEAPSLRKLAVNMEEWRWMPEQLGDFYVWVNIPEFLLRVVKDGKVIHTERVVVGKRDTPTPVLSQDLEQVIFHPVVGRAGIDQEARRAPELDARQHPPLHLLPSPHPARRTRRRSGSDRLGQRRHSQLPRLSAAGRNQRAGCRQIPLPQQA